MNHLKVRRRSRPSSELSRGPNVSTRLTRASFLEASNRAGHTTAKSIHLSGVVHSVERRMWCQLLGKSAYLTLRPGRPNSAISPFNFSHVCGRLTRKTGPVSQHDAIGTNDGSFGARESFSDLLASFIRPSYRTRVTSFLTSFLSSIIKLTCSFVEL